MIDGLPNRAPALPYGQYRLMPRRCTECGAWPVVADGRYFCELHHPEYAMGTPTLTAGGRIAPKPPTANDPSVLLSQWESTLTRMLEHAQAYHELDRIVVKRRAWLRDNPFHDLHDERHAAMWLSAQERNDVGARMMDACEALSRLQRQMPPNMVDGLSALLGHPLWPNAGQVWAMAVARMPKDESIDFFDVASWVVMEWRAETEAREGVAA